MNTHDYICVIRSSNVDYFYVGDVSLFKENSNRGYMLTSPDEDGYYTFVGQQTIGVDTPIISAKSEKLT